MEGFISNQLIVESGRDEARRPILAFFACNFPDPAIYDYDVLMRLCLKRLDGIVASEYVIVFFAGGMEHRPSFSWMLRAYQTLSRNYKKNVKRLLIVHPSLWFRILLVFMKSIVSSKFAKKIDTVTKLDDLANHIPTDDIDIPSRVRAYERATTRQLSIVTQGQAPASEPLPPIQPKPIFGVPLAESSPDGDFPAIIDALIQYLYRNGVEADSIFRKSPSGQLLSRLIRLIDREEVIDFTEFDLVTLAGLLKAYVRDLPEPLIPPSTYDRLDEILGLVSPDRIVPFIRASFLLAMDERSLELLKRIMQLLHETARHASTNNMSVRSLAIVWAPNIIRHENVELEMRRIGASHRLVEYMITYYDVLFSQSTIFWK